MTIDEIKSPEDISTWLDANIRYGWLDTEGLEHVGEMQDFRRRYRTMSLDEILSHRIGTCVEQVFLIHHLLDRLGLENRMFCCRIFEPDDYGNLEEEEHMHCFVLFHRNGKVYHLEHANESRKGIYEYGTQEEALREIADFYVKLRGGKESPTTWFPDVPEGLSFREFNAYINHQEIGAGDFRRPGKDNL